MSYPEVKDLEDAQRRINEYPYRTTGHWDDIRLARLGNCKNYVVGKLQVLFDEYGWPRKALRIGICDVEPEHRQPLVNHAVLVVTLADGSERVLDQRQTGVCTIEALHRIGYQPIEIRDDTSPTGWSEWLWVAGAAA